MVKKLQTSIEKVDIEGALHNMGGSRYNLVLAASARAREISYNRLMLQKNGHTTNHVNKPTVEALVEIAQGTIGPEYLLKNK